MNDLNKVDQIKGEHDFWQGLSTSGTIPERYLRRGIDQVGKLYYITRGTTRFGNYVHQRSASTVLKDKNTREPKVQEIHELDRIIPVTVASTSADTHSSFGVADAIAAQLQPNDILYTKEQYSYVDSNGTVHFSNAFGQQTVAGGTFVFTEVEQMQVVAVGAAGSAATGSTKVTVRRCFHGRGRTDYGGNIVGLSGQTLTTITTDYVLLRGLPSHPEGGDAPRGYHKNPVMDNNFTQEFKYAVEMTKESEIEVTWIGETPFQINQFLRARQSSLDLERAYLFGRKGKTMDAATGNVQYTMGGATEFLLKDTDHVIAYDQPTINYPNLMRKLDKISASGCSPVLDVFCGISIFTELKIALYSSGYFRYNQEATARFDVPVEAIVGSGITLNLFPLYTMEEAGWHNKMLILDSNFPHFAPITHEGWDMKIEKNIQLPGQQIRKDQWISIRGLERRGAQYMHAMYFPNVSSNIFQ